MTEKNTVGAQRKVRDDSSGGQDVNSEEVAGELS